MKHELRCFVRVSDDGKSHKVMGGDIKKFLSLHPGGKFVIHIKKDRTNQQNRFFWVLMDILGKELGLSKEECHDVFTYKFLHEELVNEATGEVFTRIKGTSELSKEEMMYFIDQLIIYCADELNITLPSPGEKLKLSL